MHSLLHKLFAKRGIKDPNELSVDERKDFDNWQSILTKDELTLEDVKNFCTTQIRVIEGKWADYNVEQARKAELIPYHTVYSALLQAIDSPKQARQALEQQLTQLLK